jgi:phenylalanine ammonia-lyase
MIKTTMSYKSDESHGAAVCVGVSALSVAQVASVANGTAVTLTDDLAALQRVIGAARFVQDLVERSMPIYGVTTGFGGMSDRVVPKAQAEALQNNLPIAHKTGAGKRLRPADVRAGMLIRVNSLMRGASGARLSLIQRVVDVLNASMTPHVYQLGSIGASGDLVPLAYVAGAVTGLDESFLVDWKDRTLPAVTALEELGMQPIKLGPKEGLALMNGTSMMTGVAANVLFDLTGLMALSLGAHALYIEALEGSNQSFHPFIHAQKPHKGQVWVAQQMLELLGGSALIRNELNGEHDHRPQRLIQDRYSLRCLPQFLGPVIEDIWQAYRQIEIEINSATDNPLVDLERAQVYHGGNFLGQYPGVAMDRVRHQIGLVAKHLDSQIALLVTPEFSHGLPPSLVGNNEREVNVGLKALQLTGNSIMPLLLFYGHSLVDRFPTHAEQFNQNINSQGYGSANLAREAIDMFQQYLAVALIFAVQAVELRAYSVHRTYRVRPYLADRTRKIYEAVYGTLGVPLDSDRPLVWDDADQRLDTYIAKLAEDLANKGSVIDSVEWLEQKLVDSL